MSTSSSKPRLIWLFIMHRHGDRSPLNMGPKDKYNDLKYWPEGFGNMNNAGRMRMYRLGQFIRRHYEKFLTDSFREVYSRSSDVERCIESSNAVLAGMYPPSDRFKWSNDIPWVPAAVHSVPAPEDYMLNESGKDIVQKIQEEIKIVQKSDRVKKLIADSAQERKLLEHELGYEYDSFYKFSSTYSTLDIEEKHGLEMPSWYTPELKQRLYEFAGTAFSLAGGGTEKLKRLRCGHLLEDIIQRMQYPTTNKPTQAAFEIVHRKVVHYSTHDSVMAALLTSLGLNDPPIPPKFGATLFIELYVDVDDQDQPVSEKYLKILYLDDTESEKPIEKSLPGCNLNEKGQLTLDSFMKYVEHLLPTS